MWLYNNLAILITEQEDIKAIFCLLSLWATCNKRLIHSSLLINMSSIHEESLFEICRSLLLVISTIAFVAYTLISGINDKDKESVQMKQVLSFDHNVVSVVLVSDNTVMIAYFVYYSCVLLSSILTYEPYTSVSLSACLWWCDLK